MRSCFSTGFELAQAENCVFSQKKHLPQEMVKGTTTRSPFVRVLSRPVSTTRPMNS